MRTYWVGKGIKILLMVVIFIAVGGYVVMSLWNLLMPVVFHLGVITFWQALGLLVLAKIIFGFGRGGWGYRGHWGHRRYYWKEQMEERLKNMTPEERDKFREEWRRRCGRWKHYDWTEEKKTEEQTSTEL